VRCFLDSNRTCSPDVQKEKGPRCRMWDAANDDCLLVALVRRNTEDVMTITTFPPSAPPPEVK
jgi:hypothetical protein